MSSLNLPMAETFSDLIKPVTEQLNLVYNVNPEETISLLIDTIVSASKYMEVVTMPIVVMEAIQINNRISVLNHLIKKLKHRIYKAIRKKCSNDLHYLLRFIASMARSGIIDLSSVYLFFGAIFDRIVSYAEKNMNRDYRYWQLYTDQIAIAVLLAIPWSRRRNEAVVTKEGIVRDYMNSLILKAENYESLRKCNFSRALSPYLTETDGSENLTNDFGGGSYFKDLLAAIVSDHTEYKTPSIFNNLEQHKPEIAQMLTGFTALKISYNNLMITLSSPMLKFDQIPPEYSVSTNIEKFRNFKKIQIVSTYREGIQECALDRIVCDRIIQDTLNSTNHGKNSLLYNIVTLPIPFFYGRALAECIFGQFLHLSDNSRKSFGYGSLMVDLCKIKRLKFPKYLSSIIRELFAQMDSLDLCIVHHLAKWLAYHIINFDVCFTKHERIYLRYKKIISNPQENDCISYIEINVKSKFQCVNS
eukprot:gnl/TRDRNA2_/TRDRNA2_178059_c0_seq4.p1 gnl/TRDRNA2_/TRDRNA2_178059_c0~~gnl/TRDRNA2_/TRDRNA2_178059_c0_seq4.p1  ORF type:complete len:474 (+),score=-16.66 gnl/TRDRNA2_/TRDRNA2_178059_c0_seq4:2281-3702(+)